MMANLSQLILEISSDEEAGFGCIIKDVDECSVGGEFGDGEDQDWLTKLLREVDRKKDNDSGDVLLVKEVPADPPKKSILQSLKPSAEVIDINSEDDDGDDDCIVLDGDPEKPLLLLGNGRADGTDSDDVEIVGEKGEVACRDFPHSRHLCAKFVFASTPHFDHCVLCHCYVCDTLAPCGQWGTGTSSSDHCHASDKEEYWRTERKRKKKGDKPAPISIKSFLLRNHQTPVATVAPPRPSSIPPRPSAPQPLPRPISILPRPVSVLSGPVRPGSVLSGPVRPSSVRPSSVRPSSVRPSSVRPSSVRPSSVRPSYVGPGSVRPVSVRPSAVRTSSLQQSQSLRPVTMSPYSVSSSVGVPNVANQVTGIAGGHSIPCYKPNSQCVSPPDNTCNSYATSTDNNYNMENKNYPYLPPQSGVKRTGFTGPSPNSYRGYDTSCFRSPSSREPSIKRCRTLPTSISNGSHGSITVSCVENSKLTHTIPSAPPIMDVGCANIPSQPQIRSDPISSCLNRATTDPEIPSHPYLSSNFVNVSPSQLQVASQESTGNLENMIHCQPNLALQPNCYLPSQASASNLPDRGTTSGSQQHPISTASSYPSTPNIFEKSSQPLAYSYLSSFLGDGQDDFLEDINRDTNSCNFDLEWEAFIKYRDLLAPADTSLLQSAGPTDNTPYLSVQKDDHDQNIASVGNSHEQSAVAPDNSSFSNVTDCLQFKR